MTNPFKMQRKPLKNVSFSSFFPSIPLSFLPSLLPFFPIFLFPIDIICFYFKHSKFLKEKLHFKAWLIPKVLT